MSWKNINILVSEMLIILFSSAENIKSLREFLVQLSATNGFQKCCFSYMVSQRPSACPVIVFHKDNYFLPNTQLKKKKGRKKKFHQVFLQKFNQKISSKSQVTPDLCTFTEVILFGRLQNLQNFPWWNVFSVWPYIRLFSTRLFSLKWF